MRRGGGGRGRAAGQMVDCWGQGGRRAQAPPITSPTCCDTPPSALSILGCLICVRRLLPQEAVVAALRQTLQPKLPAEAWEEWALPRLVVVKSQELFLVMGGEAE